MKLKNKIKGKLLPLRLTTVFTTTAIYGALRLCWNKHFTSSDTVSRPERSQSPHSTGEQSEQMFSALKAVCWVTLAAHRGTSQLAWLE